MNGKQLLINGLVVAVAVGCGFLASRGPWEVLREQKDRTALQVAEMHRIETRRESLVKDEARYRSSVGREELARTQGWLAPNEHLAPGAH